MTRTWHIDHLDGWRAELVEQDDATIDITVAGNSRIWRAVRTEIEEAIALAWHITTEQRLIGCLIDPELPA
jgi:hypothetical protein